MSFPTSDYFLGNNYQWPCRFPPPAKSPAAAVAPKQETSDTPETDACTGPCICHAVGLGKQEDACPREKMVAMELQRNALARDFFSTGPGTERTKQARYDTYLRLLSKGFSHAEARDAAWQLINVR